jgi:hypothetical protein
MNKLISVKAAIALIETGVPLAIGGPEAALDELPAGNWIAGTIPYFMDADVCMTSREGRVFVTELSGMAAVRMASYGPEELAGIVANAPDNGFSLVIIPAFGQAHQSYAAEAANYPGAFLKPTVGWVSGVHLADIGKAAPKVYDGRTRAKYSDRAVVAYVTLPPGKMASVEIVNLFEPDDGDVLRFPKTSFEVRDCEINGRTTNLAEYVAARGLSDCHLPLVGDFGGAHINVSMQTVDFPGRRVALYAPVFPGVDYHFAKPVPDYAEAFRKLLAAHDGSGAVFTCNCILNFAFGDLEGKSIGGISGPITFGEIAYQLLNQTVATVRVI